MQRNLNDIGPLLASSLNKNLIDYPFKLLKAAQTSRATVIGAGMQTTKLSGATISIQSKHLPIRNIPVIKVTFAVSEIEQQLLTGKELFVGYDLLPFAISLVGAAYLPYVKIKELALDLGALYRKHFPSAEIIVVICENDMAKALGQALRLHTPLEVICIDQISTEQGDYIDIGEPLNDTIVPVVVKTLAFRR